MDDGSIMQIPVLVLLVILSAYFSAAGAAFSSINKTKLKNLASEGNKKAERVLNLTEKDDKLFTTVLICNNIVNIAAAVIATVLFTAELKDNGALIAAITAAAVIIIFAEISPKILVSESAEGFAMSTVGFLQLFIFILAPLNWIFGIWKKVILKMFGIKNEKAITEEEILTIVEEAQQDGGINEQEGELLKSVIEFNDLEVRDILTPRVELETLEDCATNEEAALLFTNTGYSRIPVYSESVDNIIGVIHQKDFYSTVYGTSKNILSIMKEPVFIAPTSKISNLLNQLQQNKSHMAVVVDEFGGTMGIATMEDILEQLVGEIWDEHDEVVEEIKKISDDEYKILCSINLDVMFDHFGVDGESESTTVSGWIVEQFEDIPNEGDSFKYKNLEITVTKCDSRKVEEISVKIQPEAEEEDEKEQKGKKKNTEE